MALKTPSLEEINVLAQYLGRALGDTLQCVILHGSQAHLPSDSLQKEGSDADLVIVVADIALDRVPRLVEQIRWARPFRELNLAMNCVGYHALCESLSAGHPFFVSAVSTGVCIDSIDGCWDSLQAILTAPEYRVSKQELGHMLHGWARVEHQRAERALREVYRCLVNLNYNAAQHYVLAEMTDTLDVSAIVGLAQWSQLFANAQRMGLEQPDLDLLSAVYTARGQVARGESPNLGADLHAVLNRLQALTRLGAGEVSHLGYF